MARLLGSLSAHRLSSALTKAVRTECFVGLYKAVMAAIAGSDPGWRLAPPCLPKGRLQFPLHNDASAHPLMETQTQAVLKYFWSTEFCSLV